MRIHSNAVYEYMNVYKVENDTYLTRDCTKKWAGMDGWVIIPMLHEIW